MQRCDSHSSLLLLDVLLPMHHECSSINKGEGDKRDRRRIARSAEYRGFGESKRKMRIGQLALYWHCFIVFYLFMIVVAVWVITLVDEMV